MYSCYRKDDASNPEVFLAAATAILSDFSEEVIQYVTDPRTGLPGRLKWPPQPSEVLDACKEHAAFLKKQFQRDQQIEKQLQSERAFIEARKGAPDMDRVNEILARHGFGSVGSTAKNSGAIARAQQAASRAHLEKICERDGIDPAVLDKIPNSNRFIAETDHE